MNPNIEQQVQRLGQLRQQRQQLEAQEQQLARSVKSQMSEHGQSVVTSGDYEAKLTTQERLTVDPAAFRRSVPRKEFLKSVTVSVTAARDLLGDRKLRTISTVNESIQLRVTERSRRPSATAGDPKSAESCDSGHT